MFLLHLHSRVSVPRFGIAQSPPRSLLTRASLPFPPEKAQFHKELEAAVDVVQRACRLCVDVKKSLLSSKGRIFEKNDQTPVTIADFGVQALISLGKLGRLFPSIPLVAEEDAAFLRSSTADSEKDGGISLADLVLNAVVEKASNGNKSLTLDNVLKAIDRGGKDAFSFDSNPATYWVLDPIDGTRGFLKGSEALYVVGLALVVEGKIALGVMGCPNWKEDSLSPISSDNETGISGSGVIMVAHVGCGTWARRLFQDVMSNLMVSQDGWKRCFVDRCKLVHEARFCIPESQTWDSLPFSVLFSSTTDAQSVTDEGKVLLLKTCCGSLCKYLMVATGRASVFIVRAKVKTAIKVWDHAVGVICVQEAGGQVTDWSGSPLNLAGDEAERRTLYPSSGVLVSNGRLNEQLLEIISSNSSVL
ncbi:putative phosphoric monoester hydrolase [Dioscorea sansibarensis]